LRRTLRDSAPKKHIPRRLLSTNYSCTKRLSARYSKVVNRDYAKLHMGIRAANQPPRTASQYSGSFSCLRSRKTFHIGAARFKIQIRCDKF